MCDYPAEAMAFSHFFDALGAVTSEGVQVVDHNAKSPAAPVD
jgi:hypothetical protein